jgi:tetratricopeptide (TPR) repeat protein
MRRINWKLLLGVVVLAALIGGGVHLLHEVQSRSNAAKLLKEAERAEERGRPDRSLTYLDRYLFLVPDRLDILAKYAILLEKNAFSTPQQIRAMELYEQVLRQNEIQSSPEEQLTKDIRRRVARLALAVGRYADAEEHATKLPPNDGEAEQILARSYQAKGKIADAVENYKKSIKHAPKEPLTYIQFAELLREKVNDPTYADKVVADMVAANNHSFDAYFWRSQYRGKYNQPGAEEDATRAVELDPKRAAGVLQVASFAAKKKDWDQARAYLKKGLKENPNDSRFFRTLAEVERQSGRLDEAKKWLMQGIDTLPGDENLRWLLAAVQIEQGDFAAATKGLKSLGDAGYQPELIDYLNASMEVAQATSAKQLNDAAEKLEKVRPLLETRSPGMVKRIDAMLVQCYGRLERLGDNEKLYNEKLYKVFLRAATGADAEEDAYLGLAGTLEARGRYDEALTYYRRVPGDKPEVKVAIARMLFFKNMALPNDQRRWDDVDQALDTAARLAPDSPQVVLLRTDVLLARGRNDEARRLLEQARDAQPKQIEFWLALVALNERLGAQDKIPSVLDEATKMVGDRVELRLARARYLTLRGGSDVLKSLAELAKDLSKFSPDDQGRLVRGLALMHARVGDDAGALTLWNLWVKQHPDDLDSRLVAFDFASRAKDKPALLAALREIKRIDGENGRNYRYGDVSYLIWKAANEGDKSAIPDARKKLKELAAQHRDWSRISLTQAKLEELDGNSDAAIPYYLRAIDLGERESATIRRTLELLSTRHRYPDAKQVLAKLQDQALASSDLQRVAAEVSLKTEDFDSALEWAKRAVSAQSKNYRDHIRLGQVHWAAGQHSEAEAAFRRAVEVAPDEPLPRLALVQYLASTGKTAQLDAAIQDAESKVSSQKYPLTQAQCHEVAGHRDRAKELYLAALEAHPKDIVTLRGAINFFVRTGQLRQAETYLQKAVELPDLSKEDATWAKQTLSLVLTSEQDPSKLDLALEVLGYHGEAAEKVAGSDRSAEEIRTIAVTLNTQKDPKKRQEAIRLMEELIARDKSPEHRFLLARMLQDQGNWPKAKEQMLAILKPGTSTPAYLAGYVAALLRHNEADQAGPWLDQLEKLDPSGLTTAQLKAQMLNAQGKTSDAVAVLTSFANRYNSQLLPVALNLEQLGQTAAAEDLLRRFIATSKTPEDVLKLAEFLGRHNRVPEALDICERAWQTCRPQRVVATCMALISGTKVDEATLKRVEGWFETEQRKRPDAPELIVPLATLRYQQARYQDSEAMYRRALAQGKNDIMALNNLAWILAHEPGKETEALELVDRAINWGGPVPSLLDTRAVAYLAMNRTDLAIQDLNASIAGDSKSPAKYFHLAQAYWKAKDRNAANTALRRGEELGLKVTSLDPIEHEAFKQLITALGRQ